MNDSHISKISLASPFINICVWIPVNLILLCLLTEMKYHYF